MPPSASRPSGLSPPQVLCISGHDPSGGAGLQADIETVAALGGHALGVLTALTVQDSRNVRRAVPIEATLLAEQFDCLLCDCRPRAVKIGLLGSRTQLPVIVAAVGRAGVPVVCDPVLRAGGGTDFAAPDFLSELCERLLPEVDLLTPNAAEARRLVPQAKTLEDCARRLLELGCANVLITGGDEPGEYVENTWYANDVAARRFRWAKLPETFHGAGCTLAAAIACRLAHGDALGLALETAQAWTQTALREAFAVGGGRRIPRRRAASGSVPE